MNLFVATKHIAAESLDLQVTVQLQVKNRRIQEIQDNNTKSNTDSGFSRSFLGVKITIKIIDQAVTKAVSARFLVVRRHVLK